jgi:hypothetical protein
MKVTSGSRAIFMIAVIGDPAPTVQWQRARKGSSKFTSIPGATAPTLSLAATTAAIGQKFRALVTNAFGTVDSAIVTLTVAKAKRKK